MTTTQTHQTFDYVDFLIRVEEGRDMTDEEYIEGYRNLVISGTIRCLQGHHQRTAQALLDNGTIQLPAKATHTRSTDEHPEPA